MAVLRPLEHHVGLDGLPEFVADGTIGPDKLEACLLQLGDQLVCEHLAFV